MSITDELRHNIEGAEQLYGCECKHLLAIADRIDMEHERLMVERADRYSELRAKMNNCYIELPKDADNVPWDVGDCDEDGNEVTELRLTSSGWCILTDDEWPYRPERHRHYHAPTVENVLQEFTSAIFEWSRKSGTVAEVGTWSDVAAKYAAQLQLKEY